MFHNQKLFLATEKKIIDDTLQSIGGLTFNSENKFEWLMSNWMDDTWFLIGWNGSKLKTDAIKINWKQLLPNGKILTDPEYSFILERSKRLIALVRSGSDPHVTRSATQRTLALYLTSLIKWMISNNLDNTPFAYLTFEALTSDEFSIFLNDVSGGIPRVEQHTIKAINYINQLSKLERNKLLNKKGLIDRAVLSKQININKKHLNTPKMNKTLGVFETGTPQPLFWVSKHNIKREYIGNRTKTTQYLENINASETVVKEYLFVWSSLFRHTEYTDGLIKFNPYEKQSLDTILFSVPYIVKNRTPNVPFDIALHFISESIKWVVDYGSTLIEYYGEIEKQIIIIKGSKTSRYDHWVPTAFNQVQQPHELHSLRITRHIKNNVATSRKEMRENLSVLDAINCLKAACFIIIATFSMRRNAEVINLTSKCISQDFDGNSINFKLQKTSPHHILENIKRPVPNLVSHAVDLLNKLNKVMFFEGIQPFKNEILFLDKSKGKVKRITQFRLRHILDLFSDITESPTFHDEAHKIKRRWYIRPHELRRFSAYTYLRCSDSSSLSSLSWYIGHGGLIETTHYTANDLAGSELTEYIASLASTAIYDNRAKGDIKELRKMTLKHFKISDIDFLEEELLDKYLKTLASNDKLHIEIITSPEIFSGKSICIHIPKQHNA